MTKLTPTTRRRAWRVRLDPSVERFVTRKRYVELCHRYGIPNGIDVGFGIFRLGGMLFVDDDADGKPVAYAPPWVQRRWRKRAQEKLKRMKAEPNENCHQET